VACSRSHGAIVYRWQFHQTDALRNVVSVMLAPSVPGARLHILAAARGLDTGSSVHAQQSRGGALAVLELAEQFDDLGKQQRSCAVTYAGAPHCLRVVHELVEYASTSSGLDPAEPSGQHTCSNANDSRLVCLEKHGLAMAGRMRLAQMVPHDRACAGPDHCLLQVSPASCRVSNCSQVLSYTPCSIF